MESVVVDTNVFSYVFKADARARLYATDHGVRLEPLLRTAQ